MVIFSAKLKNSQFEKQTEPKIVRTPLKSNASLYPDEGKKNNELNKPLDKIK